MVGFVAALLLVLVPAQVQMRVDPGTRDIFTLSILGPADGAPSGEFRGALWLDASPVPMNVTGRAERRADRLALHLDLRYRDVPDEWWRSVRPDSFDYRVRGEVNGSPVAWQGTLRWNEVRVQGDRAALARFLELTSFEVTSLTLSRSEGRAVLRVRNPFSFPISIASSRYEVLVGGRPMGGGDTRGRILRAHKDNGVELPFRVDHREFLAALGGAVMAGRAVDGELRGFLVLRLPAGDVRVPLDLEGSLGTDGARSGVFAHPEGSTSVSPHR